jgi:hypothetical protein
MALQWLAVQGHLTLYPFQRYASVSLLAKVVSFSTDKAMRGSPFPCL